jgi:hypothetical protein
MSHFIFCYAECHYAKCSYAECYYVEFRSAQKRFYVAVSGLKVAASDKQSSLLCFKINYKRKRFYDIDSSCIHNPSFSLQLPNGPNKLECYITLGWKGMSGTNTAAYCAQENEEL